MSVAPLGFAIDTAALLRAKAAAGETAQELRQLGPAAATASDAINRAGRSAEGAARGTRELGQNSRQAAGDVGQVASSAANVERMLARATAAAMRIAAEIKTSGQAGQVASGQFDQMTRHLAAMEAALRRAEQSANRTTVQVTRAGQAAQQSAPGFREFTRSMIDAGGGLSGFTAQVPLLSGALGGGNGGLVGAMNIARTAQGGLTAGMSAGAVAAAAAGAAVLAAGAATLAASRDFAAAQDKQAQAVARIRNALGEGVDAAGTVAQLKASASEAGIAADSAVDAFARLARNSEALGATRQELLQLTETVQKLGIVSNASPGEVSSGMLQLSQALAAGKLNGDELRSLMENMPALAKAIADGLGVSVGQLRSMGAAGKLTSDGVFQAILSQTEKTRAEFEKMPDTVERAGTRMDNAMGSVKAKLGEMTGASQFWVGVLNGAAELLDRIAGTMPTTQDALTQRLFEVGRQIEQYRRSTVLGRLGNDPDILVEEQQRLWAQLMTMREKEESEKRLNSERKKASEIERGVNLAKDINDDRSKREGLVQQQQQLKDALKLARDALKAARDEAAQYGTDVIRLQQALAGLAVTGSAAVASSAQQLQQPSWAQWARRPGLLAANDGGPMGPLAPQVGPRLGLASGAGVRSPGAVALPSLSASRIQLADAQRRQQEAAAQIKALEDKVQRIAESDGLLDKQIAALDKKAAGPGAQAAENAEKAIAALGRQAASLGAMTEAVGQNRDAMRALEVSSEATEWRIQTFGAKTTPAATVAAERYAAALGSVKRAQDQLADARARQAVEDQLAVFNAQAKVANDGEYAGRRAAADARARQANRDAPGSGDDQLRLFDAQELQNADKVLEQIQRETGRLRAGRAAIGDPEMERELALRKRIEDAQRNAPVSRRAAIEAAMRAEEAERMLDSQERSTDQLEKQLRAMQEQGQLARFAGRELAVQTALLEKRRELEAQGVDLAGAYAQRQMQVTAQIAVQGFDNKVFQDKMDGIRGVFGRGIDGIGGMFVTMFDSAARRGKVSLSDMLYDVLDVGLQVANDLMKAFIIDPATSALKMTINSLLGGIGGGGFDPGAAVSQANASMSSFRPFASGGAFLGGQEVALASGGVLHGPSFFGLSGGRYGVAGEAGAEGVLPLRRHASGRLGVEASGGGGDVQIVIQDMRGNASAAPVEVEERRGSDGRRQISVMVRDEVRGAVRRGDLDRDMQSQYGLNRQVARR